MIVSVTETSMRAEELVKKSKREKVKTKPVVVPITPDKSLPIPRSVPEPAKSEKPVVRKPGRPKKSEVVPKGPTRTSTCARPRTTSVSEEPIGIAETVTTLFTTESMAMKSPTV